MCDTVAIADEEYGGWWLAKNSDREPDEPLIVEFHPARRAEPGGMLRATYITIPRQAERHAILIARPAWMWGAEMGVNEYGVAIGNEALFSRRRGKRAPRLLGMDILRLALERARTAEEALTVMTGLLETYGQGGPAGYRHRRFAYDNGFLIADPTQAILLETAGREWAARRLRGGHAALSNGYTIGADWEESGGGFPGGDFGARHFDPLRTRIAAARARRSAACERLEAVRRTGGPSFAALAALLRHHDQGDGFTHGSNRDICMHAGTRLQFWRPSATTGSMIAWLRADGPPRVAFTGAMTPCITPFRPAVFDAEWMARFFPPTLGDEGRRAHQRAARDRRFRERRRNALETIEPAVFTAAMTGAQNALSRAAAALAGLPRA